MLHAVEQRGCLPRRLADHDARRPCELPAELKLKSVSAEVHQHVVALHVLRHPAQTLQVDANLRHTLRRADIERFDRLLPQRRIDCQAGTLLEALHRLDQHWVVM